nr:pollen-specific leucine-rich repeat extensin-like protein 1 isoform X2 [Macaca nemestrina]
MTEHLSGMQIHAKNLENQSLTPAQNQPRAQDGETHQKELSPNSHLNPEPPQHLSSSALGLPQQAQDLSLNPTEEDVQQSHLPLKQIAAETDVPEAPGPTPLSPQRIQDEETESDEHLPSSSHHDPPKDSSHPEVVQKLAGDSQQALKEETSKSEAIRVSKPHPELPHPQDLATDTKQPQAREAPGTLLSRIRLAPTRLPQPQVLAPLQSRRPTLKLLSPSREEALGRTSDQTMTPSPRPPPTREADTSKLPPISPPHSKPPPNLNPQAAHSPQQVQEEKVSEVKLPLISPPSQEQAAPRILSPALEEAAQKVRLPRIPAPLPEPGLPQSSGAQPDPRPAKERKAPQAGGSSRRRIPDMQASPHNQGPLQQTGVRKKKLPIQKGTAGGLAPLEEAPPGSHQPASQLEPLRQPAPAMVPDRPNPSPSLVSCLS